ncbi:MAG: small metal-binding protein SmbP [Methylocystis sp.]
MLARRSIFAALAVMAALFVAPQMAFAQSQSEHLTQAIEETKEAIKEGKQHNASSFAEHAHNAWDHAKAASSEDPKGHIKTAMKHLSKALKKSKRTHHASRIAKGVRHAETALIHLKAANQ